MSAIPLRTRTDNIVPVNPKLIRTVHISPNNGLLPCRGVEETYGLNRVPKLKSQIRHRLGVNKRNSR
jgi:hypothetical protein